MHSIIQYGIWDSIPKTDVEQDYWLLKKKVYKINH